MLPNCRRLGPVDSRGAYPADRAAALSGVPLSTVHYWSRNGVLVPSVSAERVKLWSYADLLALRTIYWLRHEKESGDGRAVPPVMYGSRNTRWKPALATCLRTLQTDLGLPDGCQLEAVFDKLLLYEEGQFFKPHQDSEKGDEMVGTLVVILPSEYSGGAVTVEHRGDTKRFRRLESQAKDLSLLAFYADCHHAVSPIKSGVRVALTYQLRLEGRSNAVRPKVRADVMDRLTDGVREHFAVPVLKPYARSEPAPPERLVYLLDHEYTQRSLSWSHLKSGDRVRTAALRTAAERLDTRAECREQARKSKPKSRGRLTAPCYTTPADIQDDRERNEWSGVARSKRGIVGRSGTAGLRLGSRWAVELGAGAQSIEGSSRSRRSRRKRGPSRSGFFRLNATRM
jgi:hypothetical protein